MTVSWEKRKPSQEGEPNFSHRLTEELQSQHREVPKMFQSVP